jgi:pimeloyl-ACP methyl ester carboxylesterase
MTQHTHQTASTQFAEANGIRFAYRRFGKPNGVPLVFNQHYTGTMDHWDPAVTDGLAKDREVILFNNAGVSSTSGEVPATFADMGTNAIAFINALGLTKVDVLGFSIGGVVAQEITLATPDLVRRLVLEVPRRAAARAWRAGRRKATASSARATTRPIAFGSAFSSRRRPRARRRAARFLSAFDCVQRIAIPK